jgi:[acyl-carrier-protein] S-malonyltransferase
VEWFGQNNVSTIYEVGAGKVLSGLARRINRDIATAAINGPADIDAALSSLA